MIARVLGNANTRGVEGVDGYRVTSVKLPTPPPPELDISMSVMTELDVRGTVYVGDETG
jgi:hypothetical protein